MYVPTGSQQASPQATELGHKIAGVIQEYLSANPGVSGAEVMQAFGVARSLLPASVSGAAARAKLLIALSVGLLLLGILGALFFARAG
jgi:hypothetical protein